MNDTYQWKPDFLPGDKVYAEKVPINGTVVVQTEGSHAVKVRWDDGEEGWVDCRDLFYLTGGRQR